MVCLMNGRRRRGLNPNNNDDSNDVMPSGGYTYLEEYLNYLVESSCGSADFDGDDDVDWDDLNVLVGNWLDNNCSDVPQGNLDLDCDVDFADFAIFAGKWTGP